MRDPLEGTSIAERGTAFPRRTAMRSAVKWSPLLLSVAAVCAAAGASSVASAQERGHGPRWDLKVRTADVPSACTSTVFRPEMRITNNSVDPRDLSEIFVQTYFDSPLGSVSPVHSFTYVTITDASGALVGVAQATASEFARFVGTCSVAPDRKTNQPWDFFFSSVQVPPGGSATFIDDLWVGGGIFDPDCDDFTKVDGDTAFHDDVHYSLFYASTGLTTRACEWIAPLIPDANTGVNECTGAVDCSFTPPH
jgi:hypothetical protein